MESCRKILVFPLYVSINNYYTILRHASHSPPFEKNFNAVDMTGLYIVCQWLNFRVDFFQVSPGSGEYGITLS